MKSIRLEFFKMKHKHLGFMVTFIILVEIAWAYMSVGMSISRNPGRVGWYDIVLTVASMNGLFLPIICAVVVSRICDMEHKGNTWKLLISTAVKRSHIYVAKYVFACLILFYAGVLQVFAIVGFGILNQFEQTTPIFLLIKFLGGTMLTNLVVISLQQWISLAIKNQAFALCMGMIGGFIGIVADLFPAAVRRLFIWSYYTGLCPVTYNYENDSMTFITRNIEVYLVFIVIAIGAAIYIGGNFHISRQEV